MPLVPLLEHERCVLFHGDSAELGDVLPENSVDAIVQDPPAAISFMGRKWDSDKGGFDGWTKWLAELLAPAFRALKPGGYCVTWALPKTSHWTARALELAGFDIRDVHHDVLMMDEQIAAFLASLDGAQRIAFGRILESQSAQVLYQIFGSGMPKSIDMMRDIDMHLCTLPGRHGDKHLPAKPQPDDHLCPEHPERERGAAMRRTGMKPAVEHWIVARKPLEKGLTYAENTLKWGTGGLNVDALRIDSDYEGPRDHESSSANRYAEDGAGFHLTPGPRGGAEDGRWPAHLSLDEASAVLLDEDAGERRSGSMAAGTPRGENAVFGKAPRSAATTSDIKASKGGASRFFTTFKYVAKTARKEKDLGLDHLSASTSGVATGRTDDSIGTKNPRAGAGRTGGARNVHPTVKSQSLMEWLITLVTPPGGTVLDPFAGSGSTGVAALALGNTFIGCELGGDKGEYLPILVGRIRHALALTQENDIT